MRLPALCLRPRTVGSDQVVERPSEESVLSPPRHSTASGATKLLPSLDELAPAALAAQLSQNVTAAEAQDGRGPSGNARLTATTGVILLVLVAFEGLTLVSLRPLLPAHVFIGMLLIPPVALKLGSTGYRFARYYTNDHGYRLAGPPQVLMRMLGPFVIVSTLVLFGSGVALLALGPGQDWIVNLHKASFIAWLVVTGVHVLGHVLHIPGLAGADFRAPRAQRSGSRLRQATVAGALVAGLVLAIATLQYAAPWQAVIG
jgi:hypothetical protein